MKEENNKNIDTPDVYVNLDCFMGNMKDLKPYSKDLMINYDLLMSGIDSCTYIKKADTSIVSSQKADTSIVSSQKADTSIESSQKIEKFGNITNYDTIKFVILIILFLYVIFMNKL